MSRKQQLLKKHRKQKRLSLLAILLVTLLFSVIVAWYLLPLALLVVWLIHEAWFADHIFYSPQQDYHYQFPTDCWQYPVKLDKNTLQIADSALAELNENSTLFLALGVSSKFTGYLFDPQVTIGSDVQVFERGCKGKRYLNLTGQLAQLQQGLKLSAKHCNLSESATLYAFEAPPLEHQRLMIIAPHADDAELAAFGLYSQQAQTSIITVTQGEIEAENYQQQFGLSLAQAAQLKGRLRTWDSLAIPLWGGVKQENCVQLGYYCMQLPKMLEHRQQSFASLQSNESDIRTVRQYNPIGLPSDHNGLPSGENLIKDLAACIKHYQPQVVLLPHPEIDPHPDHIACYQAFTEAMASVQHNISTLLLYANHLHDNDRWPMGNAYTGVALPPVFEPIKTDALFSFCLTNAVQIDKAAALLMQHDLQSKLSLKRRIRRFIQHYLTGRRWPPSGDNEYLRKAVRKHELFWVRKL